ncbi:MAG: putative metal-binding motif-containing protein [Myxococcales bacterium]|nr:putative metal-binding motif-containing protein [Myxococcales bacterium]
MVSTTTVMARSMKVSPPPLTTKMATTTHTAIPLPKKTSAPHKLPSGYVTRAGDCDDAKSAIKPSATDVCDGVDNDCDGRVDEGNTTAKYYKDDDGDGYGEKDHNTRVHRLHHERQQRQDLRNRQKRQLRLCVEDLHQQQRSVAHLQDQQHRLLR